jgi:hypothetical protein
MYTRDILINPWIFVPKNLIKILCNLEVLRSGFTYITTIFGLLITSFVFTADISISNDHIALAIPNQCKKDISSCSTLHPPVAVVGSDQNVNENATVILSGKGHDPDPNDKLSFSWKQILGPTVALKNSNMANPSFTAPIVSSDSLLKFSLIVTDEEGAISQPKIANITVKHINNPPKSNAGPDQTVNVDQLTTLDGSKSKDQDSSGDSIKYSWKQISGPAVKLNGADTSIATFTAPSNISSDKVLEFTLTVRDNKNANSNDSVKVTDKYIPPPNKLPIADTGPDQTIKAGDFVYLNGTASKDPDGNIASYTWKQIGGPSVKLNGADTPIPSFTSPINISSNTSLAFELTVIDNKGLKKSAIGSVTVLPSPQPQIPNFTYENFTYGIKIQYPFNWHIQNEVNAFDKNGRPVQPIDIVDIAPPIESDPNNRALLQLGVEQINPIDTKNLDLYLQKIINFYNIKAHKFHLESRTTHANLAGKQAYSLVFTDIHRGLPRKIMITGTINGDRNYYLIFSAEAVKFDSFAPTVQKMINSFEIKPRQSNKQPTIVDDQQPKIAGNVTLLQPNEINPTLTPRPNNLTYDNSTYGVKIQYPSSWKVYPGLNFFDENGIVQPTKIAYISPPIESNPNNRSGLHIGVDQLTIDDTRDLNVYMNRIINYYKSSSTDFHVVSKKTNSKLAGIQAYSLVFTNTYPQGFPTKTLEKGIINGDSVYYVFFTAEAAKFNDFLPIVQKMINSFELEQ